MSDSFLTINHLNKSYAKERIILNNLNLSIKEEEIISIQGDNGSGKTTLLKILATLIFPSSGCIKLNNLPLEIITQKYRNMIGWMPSGSTGFYAKLSGLENIYFFAAFYNLNTQLLNEEIEIWKSNELFKNALHKKFYLCSTGMKNILLLFRALMHQPKMVLLDEPLASFDHETATFAIKMLNCHHKQKIIIFTSHQEHDVKTLATRSLILKGGQLV